MKSEESFNPTMIFPIEIIEIIFHHLNVGDLMNCTLASPAWNEIIGSSRKCMSKVKLTIGNENKKFAVKDVESLARKYQNIEIYEAEKFLDFIVDFMANKKLWKFVKINNSSFHRRLSLQRLIETFEDTVESLQLERVRFYSKNCIINHSFKKLKSLSLLLNDFDSFTLFSNVSTLESFKIEMRFLYRDEPAKVIQKVLERQKNLKELHIDHHFFGKNSTTDFNFPFQLEKLFINSKFMPEAFIRFLQTQTKLKAIEIKKDCLENRKALNAILTIKTLEKLTISCLSDKSYIKTDPLYFFEFQICHNTFRKFIGLNLNNERKVDIRQSLVVVVRKRYKSCSVDGDQSKINYC